MIPNGSTEASDPNKGKAMKQKSSTRLVLICGLPASGKTTLARQLAPEIPAIRLDKDQWTTQLGLDVWDDEFRVRLERQLWALTQELLAQGQSVILEWGHWARVERDEKRLGARALGVGVELHYLDAPLEELIERASATQCVRRMECLAYDTGSLRTVGNDLSTSRRGRAPVV